MDETDSASWMVFAERDLAAARYLTSMRPAPIEVICFLCQQAAEKALKAVLVCDEVPVPRSHDLKAVLA
jgi:HEPN domain-containing protein